MQKIYNETALDPCLYDPVNKMPIWKSNMEINFKLSQDQFEFFKRMIGSHYLIIKMAKKCPRDVIRPDIDRLNLLSHICENAVINKSDNSVDLKFEF